MRFRLSRTIALTALGLALFTVGAADAAKPPPANVQLKASAFSTKEGSGNLVLGLTRSAKGSSSVTVTFSGGTATGGASCGAGVDYINTPLTATFSNTTSTTVLLPICNDSFYELNETVNAFLSSPTNGTVVGQKSSAGITIQDDDPIPTIAINDVSGNEGTTLHFTVSLTGNHAIPVSVHWATADGTATSTDDYTTASGDIAWAPGDNAGKDIAISTTDDNKFADPNEYLYVNLSNPYHSSFGDNQGKGTLNELDAKPKVSVNDASANEGSTVEFTISLNAASETDVTVDWTTNDDSAVGGADCSTSGVDYVSDSDTATIAAGSTSTTVDITTCDDGVYANPDETFTLDLSNPSEATIDDGSGTGTLTEQDDEPQISIDNPAGVTEGNTITFTISMDVKSDTDVTVDWTTTDGVSSADSDTSCSGSNDFVSDADTATISAGSLSTTVVITTCDDGADDGDETFTVDLSNASGATILDDSGTGTIQDSNT
jgi:hypothetical protein